MNQNTASCLLVCLCFFVVPLFSSSSLWLSVITDLGTWLYVNVCQCVFLDFMSVWCAYYILCLLVYHKGNALIVVLSFSWWTYCFFMEKSCFSTFVIGPDVCIFSLFQESVVIFVKAYEESVDKLLAICIFYSLKYFAFDPNRWMPSISMSMVTWLLCNPNPTSIKSLCSFTQYGWWEA